MKTETYYTILAEGYDSFMASHYSTFFLTKIELNKPLTIQSNRICVKQQNVK